MIVPPREDPRWRSVVMSATDYPLQNLAAQLMISRVRLMTWDRKEASIEKAIDTAHSFFLKNAAHADLQAIFGRGNS